MLLIAKYDCFVGGEATHSVDYQVKFYDISAETNLEEMLKNEPMETYLNNEGEEVEWRFAGIYAVEWNPQFMSGDEVIGFIENKEKSDEDC